jgi:very-long-chain ceramide synthase
MKTYYLLEFAYWCQQFLLITLRVEKPRKDFTELVLHHIVTVWLIGGSYLVNLPYVGNAVFITMDWSDVFLSVWTYLRTRLPCADGMQLAKCFNYLQMEKTKTVAFGWFTIVWT